MVKIEKETIDLRELAVKRITLDDATAYLHRDGQPAYGYMVADQIMARLDSDRRAIVELRASLLCIADSVALVSASKNIPDRLRPGLKAIEDEARVTLAKIND